LIHDAGVLSLQPPFDHTHVTESEMGLLQKIIETKYNVPVKFPADISNIIDFSHFHALSHRKGSVRGELERRFGKDVVDAVNTADGISTGREKLGYQDEALPIFRSYTTNFVFDTPFRRHNIACFLEHAARMSKFKELLENKAGEIRDALGIPCYDPIVTESTWAIEYYLSGKDQADVEERFSDWLDGRKSDGTIAAETRIGTVKIRAARKDATMTERCFLCGRPGRFYKGIRDPPEVIERKKALKKRGVKGPESTIHMGRGDVGRVLGFELDTWRGEHGERVRFQDHRRGVCDDCATALNNHQPALEGLLIYVPRPEEVSELYSDALYNRRLREWEDWSLEGLCSPDLRFLDLSYWKKTKEYSESLGGLDERRARYERAVQRYLDNLEAFGAEPHGVYGSVGLSIDVIRGLMDARITLAPMSYGCVKPSGGEKVIVNGFSFDREVAACVLRLILAGVRLDPSLGLAENLESIGKKVEGLGLADLDLIVSDYSRVVEAARM